ncbi:PEP/pyruvate-binding domain-containing protein [Candidatus Uabimicrobium amorphum]|uniref:Phosphoenolpyruvate synthase n=1 Tax=Uabimicrobium amorphum TaxID=2596890 RepID=A0A5S9IKJ4_UABAM|nr:PEP/pyruvate-binding domain-containing protein [Candidatus Uabimicrobium amorphum]BBM82285.1 phosphoenolpyruvate synthase [Candidatus Uabimicrobium amorphum]
MTILNLQNITKKDQPIVGNKAFQLSCLLKEGFTVPSGFVITCDCYREFMKTTGIDTIIKEYKYDSNTIQDFCQSIQHKISQEALPLSVTSEIKKHNDLLQNKAVAVRSSAINEDTQSLSFAGQYQTILNVVGEEKISAAILKCWASLWSYRALSYRMKMHESYDPGEMAVIVQQMVPAQKAGVVFTQNPITGNDQETLVESCWGLGEAVVSGKTATDSFVVSNDHITHKTIRYKLMMSSAVENTMHTVKIPEDQRSLPSLSDTEALELAKIAKNIRDIYNSPQDIEWASANQKFYILQTRPITAIEHQSFQQQQEDTKAVYTMVDIGESWTGMFSPLGMSFAKHYQYHTHGKLLRTLGLYDTGEPQKYMLTLYGRPYVNASYWAWLYTQSAIFRDQSKFVCRYASAEMDLSNYKGPYGAGPTGLKNLFTNLFYFGYQSRLMLVYKRRAKKAIARRLEVLDKFRAVDLTTLSLPQLHSAFKEAYEYFHKSSELMGPPYFNSFIIYDIVSLLCDQWIDDSRGADIKQKIKAGASDLRTLEVSFALADLATEAQKVAEVSDIILDKEPREIYPALCKIPSAEKFLNKVQAFLRAHGVRGQREMDLATPRWLDDPSYAFYMMKTYIKEDHVGEVQKRRREREQVTKDVLKDLSWFKRKMLKFLINSYLKMSHWREATRMGYIQGIWMIRTLVHEVIRRLVSEEHVLKSEEQGIFIDYEDILDYVAEKNSAKNIFTPEKIEKSHKNHINNQKIPAPPLTIIGSWHPAQQQVKSFSGKTITGLGTSVGYIKGKARIILDLEQQIDEFTKGEILVTHFTDTAWTPLFNLATAVVTDIGSVLSHSSIVARELGIPAVVNTEIATQTIKTGDIITVDGNNGKVYLERNNA